MSLSSRTNTFKQFCYIAPLKAARLATPPVVDFCVCENTTIAPEVAQRLEETRPPIDVASFRYGDFAGELATRQAFARMLTEELCRGHAQIEAADVVVCGGLKAMTVMSAAACAEEGDVVLVVAPCYPGFRRDLAVSYGDVKPVFVHCQHPEYRVTLEALEEAYQHASQGRSRVAAVVITNPSNPIGRCYDRTELRLLLDWSEEKGIYLWSDEIYALSAQERGENGFLSMGEICAEKRGTKIGCLGEKVLIWYGLSKDFGLSGMRVGCVAAHDADLLKSIANFNEFSSVPIPLQRQLVPLLNDLSWVRLITSLTAYRLADLRNILISTLNEMHIPFAAPRGGGGMYLWIDLRELLVELGPEEPLAPHVQLKCQEVARDPEWLLFNDLLEAGVAIAPSMAFEAPEECKGFFRWCFAASGRDGLLEGIRRFKEFVLKRTGLLKGTAKFTDVPTKAHKNVDRTEAVSHIPMDGRNVLAGC